MAESLERELEKLGGQLDRHVAEVEAMRQDWEAVWTEAQDYLWGDQTQYLRLKEGFEGIQVNYVFPALQQQMALMADRKPTIVAQPWEPGDLERAATWGRILQWQYERELDMPSLCMASVLDGAVYGYYVAKVYWEPKARWDDSRKRWVGAPRVILIQPDQFGADPEAERLTPEACGFAMCRRKVRLERALRAWPQYAGRIEEAARDQELLDAAAAVGEDATSRMLDATQSRDDNAESVKRQDLGRMADLIRRARGGGRLRDGGWQGAGSNLPQEIVVEEHYFHDGAEKAGRQARPMEELELLEGGLAYRDGLILVDSQAGRELTAENWPEVEVARWDDEPIWPNGRYVLRVGKTIITRTEEEQRWPYASWPLAVGVNAMLPHTWAGLNGVEMARGLQNWVNSTAVHLAGYIQHYADPVTLVEDGALATDPGNKKLGQRLKARAGAIWRLAKDGLGRVRREPPPPMSGSVLDIYHTFARELQDQTGMQEVARGRSSQGGQATATEIAELSRASRVRTAMAATLQDAWQVQVMQMVAALDKDHMGPGEMVRVAGEGSAGGIEQIALDEGLLGIGYDVRLGTGTALPFDRERRRLELRDLHDVLGEAILPELLKAYDLENAQEILARHGLWQEFLAYKAKVEALEPAPAKGVA